MANEGTAFERWQKLQRELHELERQLAAQRLGVRRRRGPQESMEQQVALLRHEVDNLFPEAMRELEEEVARVSARRHRLADG